MNENAIVARNALEAQLRDPGRGEEIMRAMPFDSPRTRLALLQQYTDMARNPPDSVAGADPKSLFDCILGAARLGLQLNGPLQQADAVKFGNRAQLIVGYRGLVKLMRAGGVKEIHTGMIHENDAYEWTESDFRMTRRLGAERGEVIGVYAKLVMEDGSTQSEVMTVEEVEHVRSKSRAAQRGPWVTDWNQMARKTVLRRAANLVTLREREAALVAQADRTEFDYTGQVEVKEKGTRARRGGAQVLVEELRRPPEEPEEPEDDEEEPPEPPPRPQEPLMPPAGEKEPERDPDTGEELPGELPLPGAEPPQGKPKSADPLHLARAQRLASRLGLPVWQKFSAPRRSLVERRMKEEGVSDPAAFWNAAERVLGRASEEYWESFNEHASLDLLLRVPQRNNPDHWQKLAEGAARKKPEHAPLREEGTPRASSALQKAMEEIGD